MSRKETEESLQYSLALIKSLGVFGMIAIHVFFEMISVDEIMVTGHSLARTIDSGFILIFAYPALMLPMLAACSARLRWNQYFSQPRLPREAWTPIMASAVALAAIEIALGWWLGELSNPHVFFPYTFDALQLVALSFLVIAALAAIGPRWLLLVAGLAVVILPSFYEPSRETFLWLMFRGDPDKSFYWPPFPWLGANLIAFWIVDHLLASKEPVKTWKILIAPLSVVGLVALVLHGVPLALDPKQIWGESVFAAEWPLMSELMFFVAGSAGFGFWLWKRKWILSPLNPAVLLGRGVFWIYPAHLLFVSWMIPLIRNAGYDQCLKAPAAHDMCLWGGAVGLWALTLSFSWCIAFLAYKFIQKTRYTLVLRKRSGTDS